MHFFPTVYPSEVDFAKSLVSPPEETKKTFFFSISNICSLDRVIDEYLINEHFEVEIVFVVFILLENEPLVLIVFEKDGNIPLSLLLDVIA